MDKLTVDKKTKIFEMRKKINLIFFLFDEPFNYGSRSGSMLSYFSGDKLTNLQESGERFWWSLSVMQHGHNLLHVHSTL
jgi:hypothetical protein